MVELNSPIKIWCFLFLMSSVHSARILGIFPIEAQSHFNFHEAIIKCLLSNGHQVTLMAPFQPQTLHANLTFVNSNTAENTQQEQLSSVADPNLSWFATALLFTDTMEHYCNQVLSIFDANDLKSYDVIFMEIVPLYQCFLPIADKLKIPVIGTISYRSLIDADFSVGLSRPPSVFPTDDELMSAYRNPKMTFYQTITNIMQEVQLRLFYFLCERMVNQFNEKRDPEGTWNRLKVSLLFANDHEIFSPRPKPPNFINIGGIHVKSCSLKPLPEDLKKFIEDARHGVIFFSLGTVAPDDVIKPEFKFILKNTFSKIPQRVIWKSNEQIEGLSENVLLINWVPQKEVLAHKNVLAFISHSGLGSTYESIYFGKPLICMPLFGDQPSNAAFLTSLEVGLYIDLREINEAILLDAINKIINDTKYRENMADLSFKFRNDLESPTELVAYWTEYIMRHKGGLHLRAVDADVPFYQFLLLDVLIFIVFITLIFGYLILICIKFVRKILKFEFLKGSSL